MQKYVAFMTGIPFGTDREQVRKLFARLGFLNVEPFRSPDTVVFETAPVGVIGPLEAQISRHLKRSLDLDHIWTFIRTPKQLAQIVESVPFSSEQLAEAGSIASVVLLSEEPDRKTARELRIKRSDNDDVVLDGTHIYWLRHTTGDGSPPPALSELIDTPATLRSLRTISLLVAGHTEQSRRNPGKDSTQSAQSRR